MSKYLTDEHRTNLIRWLVRLDQRVKNLESGNRIGFTSIDIGELSLTEGGKINLPSGILEISGNGDFTFLYPNGTEAFHVGSFVLTSGEPVHGIEMYRPSGELIFFSYGLDTGESGFWAFYDKVGNIIFSDDAVSGQGLATPYIPFTTFPTRFILTASSENTTSGTFVPLWTMQGVKQHPELRVGAYIATGDGSTTAEIQLRNANTSAIIDGPTSVSANPANVLYELIGPIAGNHLSTIKFELDVRRTSGTGAIYATVAYAQGIQS